MNLLDYLQNTWPLSHHLSDLLKFVDHLDRHGSPTWTQRIPRPEKTETAKQKAKQKAKKGLFLGHGFNYFFNVHP